MDQPLSQTIDFVGAFYTNHTSFYNSEMDVFTLSRSVIFPCFAVLHCLIRLLCLKGSLSAPDLNIIGALQVPFICQCSRNMQRYTLFFLCVFYFTTIFGCELFSKFNMPSIFKQGDIMIGGIFPVFNKEISTTSTFEKEPPAVKCAGYTLLCGFSYLCMFSYNLKHTFLNLLFSIFLPFSTCFA